MQAMRGSQTSFQLVKVELGGECPPATLLRMVNSKGSILLVMKQVQAALCPFASLSIFKATAKKVGASPVKVMEGIDTFWAWKLGATSTHCKVLNVISLATAIKVLQQLQAPQQTVSSLESLKEPGQYSIMQLPEEVLKLNCQPDVNPTSIKVPLPLPTSMPACNVPTTGLHRRYGLQQLSPHLARSVVFTMQLGELKLWATSDFQLDRRGGGLQSASWQNVADHIHLFLGFCHRWMGVQQPTLQHFLFPHLILAFVSFHAAKQSSANTIKHHHQATGKELSWWRTKAGGHDPGLEKMLKEWLPNLSEQVRLYIFISPVLHLSLGHTFTHHVLLLSKPGRSCQPLRLLYSRQDTIAECTKSRPCASVFPAAPIHSMPGPHHALTLSSCTSWPGPHMCACGYRWAEPCSSPNPSRQSSFPQHQSFWQQSISMSNKSWRSTPRRA